MFHLPFVSCHGREEERRKCKPAVQGNGKDYSQIALKPDDLQPLEFKIMKFTNMIYKHPFTPPALMFKSKYDSIILTIALFVGIALLN